MSLLSDFGYPFHKYNSAMDPSSRNAESTVEQSMLQSTSVQQTAIDQQETTDIDILKRRPVINEKMLLAYDIAIDETAYASVEHDFQDINADLRGDEALEQFREEYDKLFLSIRKSRENERAMISKVRELAQTYSYQQQKVKTAEKMILEDQQTIDQLTHDKGVMEEAQAGQTDTSTKHMSALERAQAEVDKLKIVIDQMSQGNYSQVDIPEQQQFDDLTRQMRQNQNEYNNNNDTINALNQQVKQLQLNTNQLQQDQNTNIITIKQLKDENFILKQEANEYKNKKNLIEQEMLQLRTDCQVIQQNIEENQAKLDEVVKAEEDVQKQLTFQHNLLKEINNQKQAVNEQKQGYQKQLQQLNQALQHNLEQNKQLQVNIDKGKQHNMDLQSTILQMQNASSELQANITKQQQRREQIEAEIAEHQQRYDTLVADTYRLKLSNNELGKQISSYQQQHNIHAVQQSQVQKQMVQQATVQNSIDQQFASDQRELTNMQQEVQRRRHEINNLQKEVNNYNQQAVHLTNQLQQAQLEYKKRCQQIEELQDVMTNLDAKLKSQQMLYETVRNDKNLCQKALIEYQDKISDLRRIFRVNTHVIEQLRAEISAKDLQLMREHFQQKQYQQEKEAVTAKLEQIKIQKRENELRIQQQKEQIQQQQFVIQEAEVEHQRQLKEYKAVEQEANSIQQLLIKRNHELEDVYEKDRILQSLLKKGELRYQSKLQQLKVLRQNIQELRNQILSSKRQTSDLSYIKKEIYQLEKDLLDERAKTRALMQELQQPMNVHRWRQLEGSDPQTYQMIMKVQNLQKILNRKSAESKQKDIEIAEKERVYEELKKIVARLPTGDQVQKLQKYQQTLKQKKSELKQAREELSIYAIQAKSLQTQIEAYQNDLQQIRKEYFRAKNKEVAQVTSDWQGAPELNKYDDIDLNFDEHKYYDELNQDELDIIKQAEEQGAGNVGGNEENQEADDNQAPGDQ